MNISNTFRKAMMLLMTGESNYQKVVVINCGTWDKVMKTNAFSIMSVPINANVRPISLSSFFSNQYVIARDLKKILSRYTAQFDAGSIEKCIWFTTGEMVGGSIMSRFSGIGKRGIDYLISDFSQKVHQRLMIKKQLMGLCEKLGLQRASK